MISTYDELKTAVGRNWPNRTDLTGREAEFIQLAEAAFKRDPRFRRLAVTPLTVGQDALSLPPDLREIEAWEYNDGTHRGEIDIAPMGVLSGLKARHGSTGLPRVAAIVNGVAYFAPAPDQSYATRFSYWRKIVPLSATVSTNWLLTAHPDAYLYGALVHLEGYMKNDPRMVTWKALYDEAAEQVHQDAERAQFGGNLSVQHRVIG